ncbi:GNAT family N-acetyltransferase [Streptomyces sp. NBC_01020]|uniref:GNAT family N-acetyltransferase n=1 Tax=unclassified Streptomyces TaxID=2593676 RepID=UPI002E21E669|nr:GNAT family N-acetyltransferase [Streptomyces sp. NBC_01020]WSX71195.1 GNAT family N-acetyltransferase [Streptomyces sp. NBC_00932]
MTDVNPAKSARRPHHWRRDLIELAALFTAVALADAVADLVAHGPDGPFLLVAAAVALSGTAAFHLWWAQRHSHAPPSGQSSGQSGARGTAATSAAPHDEHVHGGTGSDHSSENSDTDGVARSETVLWRMRTTVRDEPGSLAALCTALARHQVDILTLQTHPLADGTVDEFLLRAPAAFQSRQLGHEVSAAGGHDTWIERADAHDLVDAPTRVLGLATRTALDAAELPLALRQLLGRCTIHSLPAVSVGGASADEPTPADGVLEERVMRLRDPSGGTITVERPHLPFTPTEFARARALIELDARLGPRMPRRREVFTLPEGNEITVRRAGPDDAQAARAMHDRCTDRTLGLRYHGPVGDADRYLGHLLSPRFGRTLAVQTASGRIVGLGHLLWDGDETEVALLVEDAWQRRGIGSELLGRLLALAEETGCESVYAVTQASNTGMVAAMRGLGLPLDYQIEEGTLVITARLATTPAHSRPAPDLPYGLPRELPYGPSEQSGH